jgi:enoyl-CoA hydratase/carnithine racemase
MWTVVNEILDRRGRTIDIAAMSERVSVSIRDGVADVRLNRPDKLNALDRAMFEGLIEAGAALASDESVRAVVLSGEGRGFCAGLDFGSFLAMGERPGAGARSDGDLLGRSGDSPATQAQNAAYVWTSLRVPVIAAVHGVAFGGGLQIALGADIRISAPDARYSVMEIKWGLIPDMTGTQTLRHLVRLDVAKELTYTGRIVEGREAREIGLVTRLSDNPRDDALAMATEIASKSPNAIRAAKALLNGAVYSSLEDGLRNEARLQAALIGQPNQLEAVKANLEKRAPRFTDE